MCTFWMSRPSNARLLVQRMQAALPNLRRHLTADRVVVMQACWLSCCVTKHSTLSSFIRPSSIGCSFHNRIGPGGIRRMIQQRTNVVNEQGVQEISDLLTICEFQSSVERNPNNTSINNCINILVRENLPDAFQVHRANLDHMASFLTLQNPITAASCHPRDIQKFGPIDEMIICSCCSVIISKTCRAVVGYVWPTFSSSDADTLGFHLETQASFIFP